MIDPVIAIVKGNITSSQFDKNPLNLNQQRLLISTVFPDIPIIVIETSGYMPMIVSTIKGMGFDVTRVFAGVDRLFDYKRQIQRANDLITNDKSDHTLIDVEFVETKRYVSATDVRHAIRSKDFDKYESLMPCRLANKHTFDMLFAAISNNDKQ
jgi:hypothetical protein